MVRSDSDRLLVLAADAYACGLYRTSAFCAFGAAALEVQPLAAGPGLGAALSDADLMRVKFALSGFQQLAESLHRLQRHLDDDALAAFERLKAVLLPSYERLGAEGRLGFGQSAESLRIMALDRGDHEAARFLSGIPRKIDDAFARVGTECGHLFFHMALQHEVDSGRLREVEAESALQSKDASPGWGPQLKMEAHYAFFRLVLAGFRGEPLNEHGYLTAAAIYERCPVPNWRIEWIGRLLLSLAAAYHSQSDREEDQLRKSRAKHNADAIYTRLNAAGVLASSVYTEKFWRHGPYRPNFGETVFTGFTQLPVRHVEIEALVGRWVEERRQLEKATLRQLADLRPQDHAERALRRIYNRAVGPALQPFWPHPSLHWFLQRSWQREYTRAVAKHLPWPALGSAIFGQAKAWLGMQF